MTKLQSQSRGLTEQDPLPDDCARKFAWRRRLASGGFGAVHLAEHRELARPVAIKLLLEDLLTEEEQVARFENEARITASISHPNVITLLDFGAQYGIPWIAYEYVAGKNLRALLDDAPGGLAVDRAIEAALEVADALGAAHSKGVLHRDIKPENILEAEGGRCQVTDFGIAKWSGEGAVRTKTGVILGTPRYVAPEVVQGAPSSPASDVYALGIMFFELLTGQPPFADDNLHRLLEQHLKAPIPRASERRPEVPRALDAVVARALAKSPETRYPSALAFREHLLAVRELARTATASPTAGSGLRTHRAVGPARRPFAAIAGCSAFVLLAALALHHALPRPAASPPSTSPSAFPSASPPISREARRLFGSWQQLDAQAKELRATHAPGEEAASETRIGRILDECSTLIETTARELHGRPDVLHIEWMTYNVLETVSRTIQVLPLGRDVMYRREASPVVRSLRAVRRALESDSLGIYREPLRSSLGPLVDSLLASPPVLARDTTARAATAGAEAVEKLVRDAGRPLALAEAIDLCLLRHRAWGSSLETRTSPAPHATPHHAVEAAAFGAFLPLPGRLIGTLERTIEGSRPIELETADSIPGLIYALELSARDLSHAAATGDLAPEDALLAGSVTADLLEEADAWPWSTEEPCVMTVETLESIVTYVRKLDRAAPVSKRLRALIDDANEAASCDGVRRMPDATPVESRARLRALRKLCQSDPAIAMGPLLFRQIAAIQWTGSQLSKLGPRSDHTDPEGMRETLEAYESAAILLMRIAPVLLASAPESYQALRLRLISSTRRLLGLSMALLAPARWNELDASINRWLTSWPHWTTFEMAAQRHQGLVLVPRENNLPARELDAAQEDYKRAVADFDRRVIEPIRNGNCRFAVKAWEELESGLLLSLQSKPDRELAAARIKRIAELESLLGDLSPRSRDALVQGLRRIADGPSGR